MIQQKTKSFRTRLVSGTVIGFSILMATLPNFTVAFAGGNLDSYIKQFENPKEVVTYINDTLNMPDIVMLDGVDAQENNVQAVAELNYGQEYSVAMSGTNAISIDKVSLREQYNNILLQEGKITQDLLDEVFYGRRNEDGKYIMSSPYDIGSKIQDKSTIEQLVQVVSKQFIDVKETDWFASNVALSGAYGIINGYPDGTFKPNNTVTRAEFLTMLTKALQGQAQINHKLKDLDQLASFHNIDYPLSDDLWYGNYYKAYGENFFPNEFYTQDEFGQPITRYEVVTWLQQIVPTALEDSSTYNELIEELNEDDSALSDYEFFSDIPVYSEAGYELNDMVSDRDPLQGYYTIGVKVGAVEAGEVAFPATYISGAITANRYGIVGGYPDGEFKGYNNLTRAEAATIIAKFTTPLLRNEPYKEFDKHKDFTEYLFGKYEEEDEMLLEIEPNQGEEFKIIIEEMDDMYIDASGGVSWQNENSTDGYSDVALDYSEYYDNYLLSVYDFESETMAKVKELLKVYFPEKYKNVYAKFLDVIRTKETFIDEDEGSRVAISANRTGGSILWEIGY